MLIRREEALGILIKSHRSLHELVFEPCFLQPVEESINHLVESLKETGRNPDVAAPQLALINTSKEFIQVDTPLF